MAEIPYQIKNLIEKYISALEKEDFHIEKAFLFGSYSKGKADEWSDIDIALVSKTFEGVRFSDRSKIRKITLSVSSDLSPLPFRPEDFTSENPFVREILEKGIRII